MALHTRLNALNGLHGKFASGTRPAPRLIARATLHGSHNALSNPSHPRRAPHAAPARTYRAPRRTAALRVRASAPDASHNAFHADAPDRDPAAAAHPPVLLLLAQARLAALDDFRALAAQLHASPLHGGFDVAEALAHIARHASPSLDPADIAASIDGITGAVRARADAMAAIQRQQEEEARAAAGPRPLPPHAAGAVSPHGLNLHPFGAFDSGDLNNNTSHMETTSMGYTNDQGDNLDSFSSSGSNTPMHPESDGEAADFNPADFNYSSFDPAFVQGGFVDGGVAAGGFDAGFFGAGAGGAPAFGGGGLGPYGSGFDPYAPASIAGVFGIEAGLVASECVGVAPFALLTSDRHPKLDHPASFAPPINPLPPLPTPTLPTQPRSLHPSTPLPPPNHFNAPPQSKGPRRT